MKTLSFPFLAVSGSLAAASTGLAQLSVKNFADQVPGSVASSTWEAVQQDNLAGLDFVNVQLNVTQSSVQLSGDFSATVNALLTSGTGPTTVTATISDIWIRLSSTALASEQIFKIADATKLVTDPDGPLAGQNTVPAGLTTTSIPLSRSFSFTTPLSGSGDQLFTIEWAVSATVLDVEAGKTVAIDSQTRVLNGQVVVPEPGEYALLAGLGLVGFGLWRRGRA